MRVCEYVITCREKACWEMFPCKYLAAVSIMPYTSVLVEQTAVSSSCLQGEKTEGWVDRGVRRQTGGFQELHREDVSSVRLRQGIIRLFFCVLISRLADSTCCVLAAWFNFCIHVRKGRLWIKQREQTERTYREDRQRGQTERTCHSLACSLACLVTFRIHDRKQFRACNLYFHCVYMHHSFVSWTEDRSVF